MKPKSTLRSFLAIAGSSLLAISYSHGQTILADSYLTSLNVAAPHDPLLLPEFPLLFGWPSHRFFHAHTHGLFRQPLSLVNNGASNTFNGNIIVDSGTLRIAGSPFATTTGGFTAPSMTSVDTITINRAGTLYHR